MSRREAYEEYEDEEMISTKQKNHIYSMMQKLDLTKSENVETYKRLKEEFEYWSAMEINESSVIANLSTARENKRQEKTWFLPTVAQCVSSFAGQLVVSLINRQNVKTVTRTEDAGEIITGKGMGFISKPHL